MSWTLADVERLKQKRKPRKKKLERYGGFEPTTDANGLNAAVSHYLNLQKCITIVWRQNNLAPPGRTFTGLYGVADVIGIAKNGKWVAMEGKAKGDRLTAEQIQFGKYILSSGGVWIAAYSFDQFKAEFEKQRHKLK